MADAAADSTEAKLGESEVGGEKENSSDVENEPHTSEQNEAETCELEVKAIEHETKVEANKSDLKEVHLDETSTKEVDKTKTDTEEVSDKIEVEAKESDTVEGKSKEADIKEIKRNEIDAKEVEEEADNKVVTASESVSKEIAKEENAEEVKPSEAATEDTEAKIEVSSNRAKVEEEAENKGVTASESYSKEVAKEKNPDELKPSEADTEGTNTKIGVGSNTAKENEQDDVDEKAINDSKLTESNIQETDVTHVELNVRDPNDVADNKELNPEAAAAEEGAVDILKLTGTDEAKFQKLSELMSAGEMSSQDFVNSVLSLVCSIFIYLYMYIINELYDLFI